MITRVVSSIFFRLVIRQIVALISIDEGKVVFFILF
ncbi:MAG: hypothetical protein UX09_C0060G0007 [Candidatus Uhrbacteria bacterium GW2011_GWE2_45_35]|uniref:Uncharacterized protein n=2 Tax=Candidatus Uhriibacteriota TaxID=1752732 RepID=A0A0G1LI48_9BACT|nr:MAG: hypothetical protein UW63_C0076G0007 [Candidatus Uhrbacteria bacterium GW2011_GWF2_44_350]KKU06072.1 MAG: hypothetical protein UX09_C0060G0007 [Candidatus Uhrbacteria bacterium GW2011_GWE2_45_35]